MATSPLPFLLFQVKNSLYAVGAENVREIVILPSVTAMPNLPPEIRGVINLRGKVLPLVDLRVKLGLPSAKTELDELVQLLHDREQDHRNWLTELEHCVREQRPFKLARDPHQCRFGVWYDRFQTENTLLKMALAKMDAPHQAIHASADQVLRLVEQGDSNGALRLLEDRRDHELAQLIGLFNEIRQLLREQVRELAVVLGHGDNRLAITIDQVEAVERIPEGNIEPMPTALQFQAGQLPWQVGKRGRTSETILMLDADCLFRSQAVRAGAQA
jgi:chemotaxis signal transduction protein